MRIASAASRWAIMIVILMLVIVCVALCMCMRRTLGGHTRRVRQRWRASRRLETSPRSPGPSGAPSLRPRDRASR
jgi:hypothetical protein